MKRISIDFNLIEDITNIFVVLTMQDYYSGNSTWNSTVLNGLRDYYQNNGVKSGFYNDAIYWALAFFYAYRTYNQQFLLDLSVSSYDFVYSGAFITPEAATSWSGAGREGSFLPPTGCDISKLYITPCI